MLQQRRKLEGTRYKKNDAEIFQGMLLKLSFFIWSGLQQDTDSTPREREYVWRRIFYIFDSLIFIDILKIKNIISSVYKL